MAGRAARPAILARQECIEGPAQTLGLIVKSQTPALSETPKVIGVVGQLRGLTDT